MKNGAWTVLGMICIFLMVLLDLQLYWKDGTINKHKHNQPNITGENMKIADTCVFVDVKRSLKLCPDSPSTVSSICNGRFGNQLSSFATLFAFHKKYGLRPIIYQFQMDLLAEFFENVNVPIFIPEEKIPDSLQIHLNEEEDDTFNKYFKKILKHLPSFLKVSITFLRQGIVSHSEDGSYYYKNFMNNPKPFLKGHALDVGIYPNALFFYKDYLKDIKKELRIKRQYVENAREILKNIGKRYLDKTVIYVGVHVRRTDYEHHLKLTMGDNSSYVDETYFKKGMEKFRGMFGMQGEVVFVVTSDDVSWTQQHLQTLPGVFIGSFKAKATASSLSNPATIAANAVDDAIDKKSYAGQFVSGGQDFPWLEIDLETQVLIDNVILFPRGDCCQERFGNFQVRLADQSLSKHLVNVTELSSVGYLCGKAEGNLTNGKPVEIQCKHPQKSRYIFIQGIKPSMTLELSEVIWLMPGEKLRIPNGEISNTAVRDFALLSQCNHTLLTYGTFGQWAALYAGGHAILPSGYTNKIPKEIKEIQRANFSTWTFIQVKKG